MRDIRGAGTYADIVEAPSPTDPTNTVKLGLRSVTFRQYVGRGLFTAIAQYYGIVQEGLFFSEHAFRGLKRPLALGEDMKADEPVVVYAWRPQYDYEWLGSQFEGNPVSWAPPPGRVIVVLVREESANDAGVYGSIERWNWVREDPVLPHAPVGSEERYGRKLWSRGI